MSQNLEEEIGCIVGAIVQLQPKHSRIVRQLKGIDGVEVHAEDERARLVITIEAATSRETMKLTEHIQNLDGVLQVTPVYQHNEEAYKNDSDGGWKWR